MNIGLSGEVRFVVRGSDGEVVKDTGYIKNIILNQGLDVLGGHKGYNLFDFCVLGGGNSTPQVDQTSLDNNIAIVQRFSTRFSQTDYSYEENPENLYKVWAICMYRFTGLNNVNISEVGLASGGGTLSNHTLCTRTLIKDAEGAPTSITMKSDETLDVYYKLWQVFSVEDTDGILNVDDGNGGVVPYNYKVRIAKVGSPDYTNPHSTFTNTVTAIGMEIRNIPDRGIGLSSSDIGTIKNFPSKNIMSLNVMPLDPYVVGSYKKSGRQEFALDWGNGSIRTITFETSMGQWQVRIGSVLDDSPLVKTNKEKMTIPYEFSWGRYEGEL